MKAATWATTAVGPLKWVAAVDTGLDAYGAGKATYNLSQSYQDNGKFELEDTWNLLAYVPFAGAILGTKKFFAANKAIKGGAESSDGLLKNSTENVVTKTGNCFVAGTEILTTDGIKNIEDIQVGDWVIADDPTTPGGIAARQVLETFVRETDGLIDLYVDGEVISTTAEHPFWVPGTGWVEAKDLQVGSLLQTEDGRIIDVDKVEKREGQFEVYNFKVEDFHTYFVSQHHLLVHNADCTDIAKRIRKNRPGGKIITIKPVDSITLPYPPNMRPDANPWYYHDVYVRNGLVYDPMGFGDELGKAGIPYDDWIQTYGGTDNVVITDGPARGK